MQSFLLDLNGLRHQIYTWGDPNLPKLFFIHGWMDAGASFRFVCEQLQEKFYCIAPDLRGFGKSEATQNPLGYFFAEYVADLHALFEKLSPNETIKLVGHSMGGNIASAYAGTFPEKITHLINLEGLGFHETPPGQWPQKLREWIQLALQANFKPKIHPSFEALVERLQKAYPRLPESSHRWMAEYLGEKTESGYWFAFDLKHKLPNPYPFQLKNTAEFWRRITAKCLIVIAEETNFEEWLSDTDPKEEIKRRIDCFPKDTQQFLLKKCGHMMHLEKPSAVAQLILDFLT